MHYIKDQINLEPIQNSWIVYLKYKKENTCVLTIHMYALQKKKKKRDHVDHSIILSR